MTDFPLIPGYRIEREVGAGGMATVYLAVQERLNRRVAVKVLSPVLLADKQFIQRFLKEAETAANLHHSNIVPIHDVGRAGDHNYIVMEYLEESLKERIKQGPLSPEAALDIVLQVGRGLDYAHAEGFVHRDIKPENIMFRRDGTPVLTDFGIARAVDSATKLTKTGMSIGTPHYMSPEQGRGEKLDGRADIYSLGVVLFETLTGRVPYDAENTVGIVIKHIQEPVPSLPSRLARYQPLLERMMAKEREARVQSGAELVRLVQELESAGVERVGASGVASRAGVRDMDGGTIKERERFGRVGAGGAHGARKPTPVRVTGAGAEDSLREKEAPGGIYPYESEERGTRVSSPNRTRNALIGVLGGALVVTVGILIVMLSRGDREPVVLPGRPISGGGAVSDRSVKPPTVKPTESGVRSSYEEEQEEKYKGYFDQAQKSYEDGDYELARRYADRAAGIKRTSDVEDLEGKIGAAIKKKADAAAAQELERRQGEKLVEQSLADDSAWAGASGEGTEEAYKRYLDSYPAGRHATEANQKIRYLQAEAESRRREEEESRRAVPTAGRTWRESLTGMEFVWIPGGEFDMGSNSSEAWDHEKPVHRVHVEGFWMGKYEVTQGQWKAVMGSNPSHFKKGDNYPVERVRWEDAQEFIRRLNSRSGQVFRLPTEAEWEYACRAGTTEERYGNLDDIAWYDNNSGRSTHQVGQKRPNSYGLYDMLGNVWEWCQDWYGTYSSGYVRNPTGPSSGSGRVFRGGSWYSDARFVRAASRGYYTPSYRNYTLGFRLARTQ